MKRVDEMLRECFGLEAFRPGQRQVIESLLDGRSAAAVFPTGGGKSLCYQLPALLLEGVTLVVSPLIALMKDQIDALAQKGIDARRLDSSLSAGEIRDTMGAVRSGNVKLLYVAPERFNNERFREAILGTRVSLFAVDEAHCISEWGHNFRPDYLKLARFAARCGAGRRLALTATATPRVLQDICQELEIAADDAVRTGFYRPNLTLLTTPVAADQRDARLVDLLKTRQGGATIVYVTLQRTAERVASQLATEGFDARPYHAGLNGELRAATQEWFLEGHDGIVVATIAFGMGIDKPDIRYVYHYNLPKSLEGFSQEIGRAGRDGEPATCELLACSDDLGVLENFAIGDTPDRGAVTSLIEQTLRSPEVAAGGVLDLSIRELATRTDIRDLVVRTLLTYLELDGWIEGGTPRYSVFRYKPLRDLEPLLMGLGEERRAFLETVLASARRGRTWFTLDADDAARRCGSPRDRVVVALDWLGQQGWIELEAKQVRLRYHVERSPSGVDDQSRLVDELMQKITERERRELERLGEVVALVEAGDCQVSRLGAHFGEPLDGPCGHCSCCMEGSSRTLGPRAAGFVADSAWQEALDLRETHEVLRSPRTLVRLLCGISSPGLARARLTRHALFGAMSHVSFEELLARAGAVGS